MRLRNFVVSHGSLELQPVPHALARKPAVARRKIPGHRVERVESDWLAGKCDLLLPLLRSMVCDRKKETGRGARGVLVAEPGRLASLAGLCHLPPKGLGLHL